jgi:hypothetical protein
MIQNETEMGKNKVIKTQGAKRYLTLNYNEKPAL